MVTDPASRAVGLAVRQVTLMALPDTLKRLPRQRATGNDMRMLRDVLEQFWPSRRMDAFDQFCS
jgi:hypothetical protein